MNKSVTYRLNNVHQFGEFLSKLRGYECIKDFILFAALSDRLIDFNDAALYQLQEPVLQQRTIVTDLCTLSRSSDFCVLEQTFDPSYEMSKVSEFRGRIHKHIERHDFSSNERPSLIDAISMFLRTDESSSFFSKYQSETPPFFLGNSTVLLPILSPVLPLLLVGRFDNEKHRQDIIEDSAITAFFSHIVEIMLEFSSIANNLRNVLEKNCSLSEDLEKDLGSFIISRGAILSYAHNLRADLAGIRSIIHTYTKSQHSKVNWRLDRLLELVQSVSYHLNTIIDLSRLGKSGYASSLKQTDLQVIIRDVLLTFAKRCKNYKVTVDFTSCLHKCIVMCDKHLLSLAIYQLLDNALTSVSLCKGRKRNIYINIRQADENILLTIQDNGVGINTKTIDLIWHQFYSTWRRGAGCGLGLTICRRIVEDIHGGSIRVESKWGYGAIFTIILPSILKENKSPLKK